MELTSDCDNLFWEFRNCSKLLTMKNHLNATLWYFKHIFFGHLKCPNFCIVCEEIRHMKHQKEVFKKPKLLNKWNESQTFEFRMLVPNFVYLGVLHLIAKEQAWIFAQDLNRTRICLTSKRIPLLHRGTSLSPAMGTQGFQLRQFDQKWYVIWKYSIINYLFDMISNHSTHCNAINVMCIIQQQDHLFWCE